MSGALALLNDVTSWRDYLRPGSFRGAPFYVDGTQWTGGRRLVTHEYPLRDDPYTEDLGRSAQHHRVRAWVVGDGYMAARDALVSACQDYNTAATLVHPYLGNLNCRAGKLTVTESKDEGGYAAIDIEFVVDGAQVSPLAASDTASGLLSSLASMATVITSDYQAVSLIVSDAGAVLNLAGNLLGGLASDLLTLPATTIALLGTLAEAVAATPDDDVTTCAAIQAWTAAAVANIQATQTPVVVVDDPVLGTVPQLAPPADLSGGLAGLAVWNSTAAPPIGAGPVQAAQAVQQAAIIALVQGNAIAALLQVYAGTVFPTSNAATAARAQVIALTDAQIEAAANAGQDDLYRGWRAVQALAVTDLIARAQSLPTLANYSQATALPSLYLAQLFYQDATRAPQLEALNDVPNPLFMPFEGVRLSV